MSVELKDPDAVLDYSQNWTTYLAVGESISASTWAIEGGDASPVTTALAISGTPSLVGAVATAFVSGGTKGQVYTLRNRIVTNQGRTDDRSWTIRVEPR
jgi:hypothetical protein